MRIRRLIFTCLSVMSGLVALAELRVHFKNIRQQEENKKLAENYNAIQSVTLDSAAVDISKILEENPDILKNLEGMKESEKNEENSEYEEYSDINDTHALGKYEGNYYLIDLSDNSSSKLNGATQAFICPIKNENDNTEFKGLFISNSENWFFLDLTTKEFVPVDERTITQETEFVMKDGSISALKN